MIRRAARLRSMPAYPFARWDEVCKQAKGQGIDVLRLDLGVTDLMPPREILKSFRRYSMKRPHHRSSSRVEEADFRKSVAEYYGRRFSVALDPDTQVVPLLGTKEGIAHLSLGLLDPENRVLVPDPGYAAYSSGALLAGGIVKYYPLERERGYTPNLDLIPTRASEKASMMWLNYPNSPTGATAGLEIFSEIIEFARLNDILVCHDALYSDIAYRGYRPPSLLQVPNASEVAIEFNSLSKTFNMAGWRIGFAVGNPDALESLRRIKSYVDSGLPDPLIASAVAALSTEEEWISTRNAEYEERLGMLREGLRSIGIQSTMPQATPYLWCDLPLGQGSWLFAKDLLKDAGIAVAPGVLFGVGGEGRIRVSATSSRSRIDQAIERIQRLPAGWPRHKNHADRISG